MFIKKVLCAAVLLATSVAAIAGPLTVENGKFIKDGKPFYGVGVNYFDAFTRTAMNGNNKTYEGGFATLEAYNVPFIRINTLGFWPKDINTNYLDSQARKDEYHRRMKAFLDAAEAHHIGVIFSVFFDFFAFSDLAGQDVPNWGVQNGPTRVSMRAITTDLVSHYKDHPAVWAWEFANEATAFMDLTKDIWQDNYKYLIGNGPDDNPNASKLTFVAYGSRPRSVADNFTPETILSAIDDFSKTVKAIAPTAVVFSGNQVPRENAYHLQNGKTWTLDTPEQFGQILARNDRGLNTLSMHLYPPSAGKYFSSSSTVGDIIGAAMARSNLPSDKRPFFLGEFGSPDTEGGAAVAQTKFYELTKAIMDYKVPMSALWVFDFAPQNGSYNVSVSPELRLYQLQKVQQMNVEMATWP